MSLDVAPLVMESYAQIDREIDAFQLTTQLQCPPGCGWCCENPNVEATPLEMMPLAIELFQRGEVEAWLARVQAVNHTGACVFYRPDPLVAGNGRCQVYQWRPAICRLFGFATITNRAGQPELATCVRHKQMAADAVERAQAAITDGLTAPNFAELCQQVANLDPYLGTQRLPINQALQVAIERVGLQLQMQEQD